MWEEIKAISSSGLVNGKAWLMLGDFNQVCNPDEHSRAVSQNVNKKMRKFRDCLGDAELEDLNF